MSVPALFAHQQVERLEEVLHLPGWAWIVVASLFIFLIGRLHEFAVELADRVFNRAFHRTTASFAVLGRDVLKANDVAEIEKLLSEGPLHLLKLASAAVFRWEEGTFRRHTAELGWSAEAADQIDPDPQALAAISARQPFLVDPADAEALDFPSGLEAPTVAIPVGDRLKCFAMALYGPHVTGADLTADERAMLGRLAEDAALAYAHVETESLRSQVASLNLGLSRTALAPAGA